MSATKGPYNPYGTQNRNKINYPYAKSIYTATLDQHYERHKSKLKVESLSDYVNRAFGFADQIDYLNHDSFVDHRGSTFKYSYKTKEFIIVDKTGMIITYYKATSKHPDKYWEGVKRKNGK